LTSLEEVADFEDMLEELFDLVEHRLVEVDSLDLSTLGLDDLSNPDCK
jgi:hypothetical protein